MFCLPILPMSPSADARDEARDKTRDDDTATIVRKRAEITRRIMRYAAAKKSMTDRNRNENRVLPEEPENVRRK